MNYGFNGAYETTTDTGMSTGNDYFHSHHYHHHHPVPHSNGFHNSSRINLPNQFDDNEDEQQQEEQQIDDDYEIIDTDRPKLLMWGLTK